MFKTAFLAVLALVALASNAEARQRHRSAGLHPECNVTMPCVAPYASTPDQVRVARGKYVARQMGFGSAIERTALKAKHRIAKADWRVQIRQKPSGHVRPRTVEAASYVAPTGFVGHAVAAVSGIVAPLAAKVAEIQSACGSRVVSAVRHTYVAGTRKLSLHASGQAVDLVGNPGCIYGMLQGWPGGYSTDYARVRHVHLSYGGREHGIRFAHGGHKKRYARRHHHRRYASAS